MKETLHINLHNPLLSRKHLYFEYTLKVWGAKVKTKLIFQSLFNNDKECKLLSE